VIELEPRVLAEGSLVLATDPLSLREAMATLPGMITLRPSGERGRAELGWLDSRHTFSFSDYYDPKHMGFRALRVINEDRVAPGKGFGTHPHRDMEIVSYVLEGALEHKDSMGTGSVIRPGDVQRMSAGTGVLHSEFNASKSDPVHFLQIWILPERAQLPPGYEQKTFPEEERKNRLCLIAARDGRDGAITVHQDAAIYAGVLAAGASVTQRLAAGRHAWVQVARGAVELAGKRLAAGDGAAVSDEAEITLVAREPAEVIVFDLA
jgi:redox-sensitive bicupin YhaK (pirin superfamily)